MAFFTHNLPKYMAGSNRKLDEMCIGDPLDLNATCPVNPEDQEIKCGFPGETCLSIDPGDITQLVQDGFEDCICVGADADCNTPVVNKVVPNNGTVICNTNVVASDYAGAVLPDLERPYFVDRDYCDGSIDEGFSCDAPDDYQIVNYRINENEALQCMPLVATPMICVLNDRPVMCSANVLIAPESDGIDNDCDGIVDEE